MKINHVRRDGNIHVDFSGRFDEALSGHLAPLAAKLQKQHVVFGMSGVAAINSIGYHQWTVFLKDLAGASTFEFVDCPPDFIEYCNLLPELSFARNIVSVQIPYICEECSFESSPSLDLDKMNPDRSFKPLMCPYCSGVVTAQREAAHYLSFMTQLGIGGKS